MIPQHWRLSGNSVPYQLTMNPVTHRWMGWRLSGNSAPYQLTMNPATHRWMDWRLSGNSARKLQQKRRRMQPRKQQQREANESAELQNWMLQLANGIAHVRTCAQHNISFNFGLFNLLMKAHLWNTGCGMFVRGNMRAWAHGKRARSNITLQMHKQAMVDGGKLSFVRLLLRKARFLASNQYRSGSSRRSWHLTSTDPRALADLGGRGNSCASAWQNKFQCQVVLV